MSGLSLGSSKPAVSCRGRKEERGREGEGRGGEGSENRVRETMYRSWLLNEVSVYTRRALYTYIT